MSRRRGDAGRSASRGDPTSSPLRPDDPGASRDLWRRRASPEEARRAALVQDFEARRAAAETAFRHALAQRELMSPAERLIAAREQGTTPGTDPSLRPSTPDDPRRDDPGTIDDA